MFAIFAKIMFITIVMSWPYTWEAKAQAIQVPLVLDAGRCRHGAPACMYDWTIYFDYRATVGQRERIFIHELGHFFQSRYLVWQQPGGWDEFERLAWQAVEHGTEHQQNSVLAFTLPHELHAELPLILKGNIPPELANWYPWFRY